MFRGVRTCSRCFEQRPGTVALGEWGGAESPRQCARGWGGPRCQVGMRPWQWERGGSEMVKKNEQHVIVDDPTETDLCIFHDILMSTSLKLVCAYLLGHLWGRSSEQSPCFFWHFFQLAETMLSRSAVPENSHKKSNKKRGQVGYILQFPNT